MSKPQPQKEVTKHLTRSVVSVALHKQKPVKVPIADIIIDVYVREKTDPEYVFHLATLYEAGVEMNPIEVTESLRLIEGRHRVEAANLAGLTEIDTIITPDRPRKQMIADAMMANIGGKRAPTKADILISLEAMVKAGASEKWIREQVPFPRAVMDNYLGQVRGAIQRQKLAQAREILSQGFTVEQAASQVGLTVESIQTRILKQPAEKTNNYNLTAHRTLTDRNRTVGQANRNLFDVTLREYLEGELTKDEVLKIADAVENHGKLSVRAAEDFRQRFFQRIA